MGVKHFYYWYSRQYRQCIGPTRPYRVDILGIDMNGIFHGCAQKVYRYGNFAETVPLSQISSMNRSLLRAGEPVRAMRPVRITPAIEQKYRMKLLHEICQRVEDIVRDIGPQKTLLLCVDGVAGLGKMNQQRQRRFRTSQDRQKHGETTPGDVTAHGIPLFNPNQFTPGTPLMDHITRHLDGFIRQKQSTDASWQSMNIVFSNEKAPGEGEHKIMHYIRQYADPRETVCIYGMDADLVMLAMLLPTKNVLIARETDYYRHEYIVVSDFVEKVLQELDWTKRSHPYSTMTDTTGIPSSEDEDETGFRQRSIRFQNVRGVQDFIVLCFLVGNDFLPTTPSLSIMDGGLQLMFEIYRENGRRYGHLTQLVDQEIPVGDPDAPRGSSRTRTVVKRVVFGQRSMGMFLSHLSRFEQGILEKKYSSGATFHHDPIITRYSSKNAAGSGVSIDLDPVRADFYQEKFPEGTLVRDICHHYFDGMLWVANYYRTGIPDWLWNFPYLYGPFLKDLAEAWKTYEPRVFQKHLPVDPFLQLLMVLPPSDQKTLVPSPLHISHLPHVRHFFPESVKIDLSGKKKDWEGIVHLPMIPYSLFSDLYRDRKPFLSPQDARRNIRGRTFVYRHDPARTTTTASPFPQCQSIVASIFLPN